MKKMLILICLLMLTTGSFASETNQDVYANGVHEDLVARLGQMSRAFPGEVGIAILSGQETLSIKGDVRFPMFSVVKFPQALTVCDVMRQRRIPLGRTVYVTSDELDRNTWSPMLNEYPDGGSLSVAQLLQYSLKQSDNNACDILFREFASTRRVRDYIQSLGFRDCNVMWNEAEQHADPNRAYDNWFTPVDAARLMDWCYKNRNMDEYSRFVWKTMADCQTGANRIPKYISYQTSEIIHKTGTGGFLPGGKSMGMCDVACLVLPNGRHIELAVFIKNTTATSAECEELIATVAKLTVDAFCAPSQPPIGREPQMPMATEQQVRLIVDQLHKENFDDKRYETAMLCVKLVGIPVEGLKMIVKEFSFDDKRLHFLKEAYPYCPDRERYRELENCFSFDTNADEFRIFIYKQR